MFSCLTRRRMMRRTLGRVISSLLLCSESQRISNFHFKKRLRLSSALLGCWSSWHGLSSGRSSSRRFRPLSLLIDSWKSLSGLLRTSTIWRPQLAVCRPCLVSKTSIRARPTATFTHLIPSGTSKLATASLTLLWWVTSSMALLSRIDYLSSQVYLSCLEYFNIAG